MALSFSIKKSLRNVPQIVSVGFDSEGSELFELPPRQKFITSHEHADLDRLLKKPHHRFSRTKTLKISLDKKKIVEQYLKDVIFHYKDTPLKKIKAQQEQRPSNSPLFTMFEMLFL